MYNNKEINQNIPNLIQDIVNINTQSGYLTNNTNKTELLNLLSHLSNLIKQVEPDKITYEPVGDILNNLINICERNNLSIALCLEHQRNKIFAQKRSGE